MQNAIETYLAQLDRHNGVYVEKQSVAVDEFEELYLHLREHEGRVYSDDELLLIPSLTEHLHAAEWKRRARSARRLLNYFSERRDVVILDLGCGNGWFSNMLATNLSLFVVGLDVNTQELEQASRVFSKDNLRFLKGDCFGLNLPANSFDYVTINAAVQYFQDLESLMNRLFELLKVNGEIHIIDSPFYRPREVNNAKERSRIYYHEQGFPEMASFYYHHTFELLARWNYHIMYNPVKWGKLKKILFIKDSPMPWIRVMKTDNGK